MAHPPFLKTILPESYGYGEPVAALVDLHSQGIDGAWMSKRSAAGVFRDVDLRPERDSSIIHLIAMGATDRYGLNRNGDGFRRKASMLDIPHPEPGSPSRIPIHAGLMETHDTFEKFAKVFRNHINKDPLANHGDVLKSAYNLPMDRVELLIKVANDGWSDDLEKLAKGQDTSWSMSTRVPYDICTQCGHKAASQKEYCEHARDYLTEMLKDGHQVGVMNDHMRFFDISRVTVPADRIALGLLKAASGKAVSGSALSESVTLFPPNLDDTFESLVINGPALDKQAVLGKLAEIEKMIEGRADADSPFTRLASSFDPSVFPSDSGLNVPRCQLMDLLGSLADAKVSLPLRELVRLVVGPRFNEVESAVEGASKHLPGIFGRLLSGAEPTHDDESVDFGSEVLPRPVRERIFSLRPGMSLSGEPVKKRITLMVLRGGSPSLSMKSSSFSDVDALALERRLARVYAMYKVAFCQRVGVADTELAKLAVLQNYCG